MPLVRKTQRSAQGLGLLFCGDAGVRNVWSERPAMNELRKPRAAPSLVAPFHQEQKSAPALIRLW
jgi:hypothetical protein